MNWQGRLRDLVLAGGAVAATACSSSSSAPADNVPCGNANPDPCICGRPDADAQQAALCKEETSCQAAGGVFDPSTCSNCAPDGGVVPPHCTMPGDGGTVDATEAAPSIPCGNANPDPCICGRPDASASAAALCAEEMTCQASGGLFDPDTCGNCGADGGETLPHCTPGGDPGPPDASRADAHD